MCNIYGSLGGLASLLFGGPGLSSIEVNPEEETAAVHASFGSYTLRGDEINRSHVCIKAGLRYRE